MLAVSFTAPSVWLIAAVVPSRQNAQLVPYCVMVPVLLLPCWLFVALSPSANGWLLLMDGLGTGSWLIVATLPSPFWLIVALPPSTDVCVTFAWLAVPTEVIVACDGLPLPPPPFCRMPAVLLSPDW